MKEKPKAYNDRKEARKELFTNFKNKTMIYKGDKRLVGERYCTHCGRPLAKFLLSVGETQAIEDHYSFDIGDFGKVNMCVTLSRCWHYDKGGEK